MEYSQRLAHRADSTLVQLADSEFERGLEILGNCAATASPAEAVVEPTDFFAYRSK